MFPEIQGAGAGCIPGFRVFASAVLCMCKDMSIEYTIDMSILWCIISKCKLGVSEQNLPYITELTCIEPAGCELQPFL